MKKLLTVTLVFVFALALVFALGCNKKEEPASTEGSMDQSMEQSTPPAMTDSIAATDTIGTGH